MHVAGMNVRITIQKNEIVVDEIGNHENTWSDYFTCWATTSDKSGDEDDAAGQTVVTERMDFTVRYSSETRAIATDGFRILMGDQIYNIRSIDDMAFKHKSLKMHGELERR